MNQAILAPAVLRIKRIQEREKYEERLIDFAEYVWPVVEPAIPFVRGWAIEAIAEHLEAVTHGYIKRLLINVPPGFTKSLFTDVFWPAWEWGPQNKPWYRYICASYSNHLTERDNMRCRNVVLSDRYVKLWGNRFGISNEQFTKVKFANTKTGWKLATSVGGIGTGERGDRCIADDANNPLEMESEAIRDHTNMWFTEILPDRLNNPQESAIVVIQQRTHEEDVSGTALSRDMGYTHLMIPMRYIPGRYLTGWSGNGIKSYKGDEVTEFLDSGGEIFWKDPRDEEGELAWVERFPKAVCDQLEADKGPYAWAGQYQQNPEPRGGAIIKRDYWQVWHPKNFNTPPMEFILASLDTAYTAKEEGDASALTIWGVFRDPMGNPRIVLMYAWEDRLEFHDLIQRVIDTCTVTPAPPSRPRFPVDKLIIENKASGPSIGQELYRMFRGSGKLGIELINPKLYGDKVARVHAIEHLFADEMIYAPNKEWADKVIDQCAVFPRGSKDDLVDSTSQALRYLRDTGFALKREEYSVEENESLLYISPRQNMPLYEC